MEKIKKIKTINFSNIRAIIIIVQVYIVINLTKHIISHIQGSDGGNVLQKTINKHWFQQKLQLFLFT